jgi:hypothetical protein
MDLEQANLFRSTLTERIDHNTDHRDWEMRGGKSHADSQLDLSSDFLSLSI